jgi:hypothetical protein
MALLPAINGEPILRVASGDRGDREKEGGMQFQSLGGGVGFLKAGFLGFNKSGKSYTSVSLAIGTRAHFGLTGPVAMLDTEDSAQYQAPRVKRETGLDLVGVQTRAFQDSVDFLVECQKSGVSVVILDSLTHTWRELVKSYLDGVNRARAAKGLPPRTRLQFEDWGPIKDKWAVFADLYLNSPMHVIICGRAGYEYDYEENEETGKKELKKTGIKMKTEGEFGFEPSLLVEMERVQNPGTTWALITHRALIIGDRFGVIDGKSCDNPTFDFFKPYLDMLTPGAHAAFDATRTTPITVDEQGDVSWQKEKRARQIACEEVQGLLASAFPGQSANEKKARVDLIDIAFGTRSWTAVENMQADVIKAGLARLPAIIDEMRVAMAAPVDAETAVAGSGGKKGGKK